jgi:outer membrane lipoprotein-sorting protein
MMPFRRQALSLVGVCLLCAATSSCLARRRMMSGRAANSKPLMTADLPTLLAIVQKQFDAVHDFSAQVDMVPALGSTEKSQITEYKDVRAYIRFRRPGDFRLVGLMPVIRTTMFDMVSDGANFKLYIPSKGLFIVGRNALSELSPNKMENLRPQHFLDALVVKPIDTKSDKVIFENFTDEDNAFYKVYEVTQRPDGSLKFNRSIWFSRIDLAMVRQMIFDDTGNILTDARYSEWHIYDKVPFPKHIEINRPRDEYAVVLDLVKMDINKGLADDQFGLEQPEGATLKTVGEAPVKGPQK